MPKISIITICYNEKNIERTCESIINQTFQNFEWIVVDGGSTDGTLDILNKYKDRINVFISEKDNGLYNAMNKGIKLAKGEWLNFMNGGDCFYENETLEKVFKNTKYATDILYGDFYFCNQKSHLIKLPDTLKVEFFIDDCINHQATFIKKELFLNYGVYNEKYKIVSDFEKWLIFLKFGCKFKHLNQIISKCDGYGVSAINRELFLKEREQVFLNLYSVEEFRKLKIKNKKLKKINYKFLERIFSVKNQGKHKVLRILGIKIKFKRKNK